MPSILIKIIEYYNYQFFFQMVIHKKHLQPSKLVYLPHHLPPYVVNPIQTLPLHQLLLYFTKPPPPFLHSHLNGTKPPQSLIHHHPHLPKPPLHPLLYLPKSPLHPLPNLLNPLPLHPPHLLLVVPTYHQMKVMTNMGYLLNGHPRDQW